MALILPQSGTSHQRLWLLSGTGEGPFLATSLLGKGWHLRVSVVSEAAARVYPSHPCLEIKIGALGAGEKLKAAISSWPCRWVIDATHPFASQIHRELDQACSDLQQPLLRYWRPELAPGKAKLLPNLAALANENLEGKVLFLALGARELSKALQHSRASDHCVRLLPSPEALKTALTLGLSAEKIACLRPHQSKWAVEAALCRQWGCDVVLTRQSGGNNEAHWHELCEALNLQLLLLSRPPGTGFNIKELMTQIGQPRNCQELCKNE
ncbi:precorrin-6A/cobalt-precorrin-6A reductase [Synechococcus sp. UW140]|uniref:precorrin-6A/cobalt-precorrin-6A reductase n=1 Tax=Synechococcus sp. UW140 TaxID=368503 RepID=UPI0025EE554E|nr:precorrin-6A/cobalt-precorrin-6A reductase [Synechococcus sp. UW140]